MKKKKKKKISHHQQVSQTRGSFTKSYANIKQEDGKKKLFKNGSSARLAGATNAIVLIKMHKSKCAAAIENVCILLIDLEGSRAQTK